MTSKTTFRNRYPTYPEFAGGIVNILEDQYIDYTRTRRFPGLKTTEAFVVEKLYQDDEIWPPLDAIETTPKAMLEGVRQVAFCGHAKGIADCADWLREVLGRVRPPIEKVRREASQPRRAEIANEVMVIAEEYLPEEDLELPATCVVCEAAPPTIIAPLRGPVCEDCVSDAHGPDTHSRPDDSTDPETHDDSTESAPAESSSSDGDDEESDGTEVGEDPGRPSDDDGSGQRAAAEDCSDQPERSRARAIREELRTMDSLARDDDVTSWWDVPENVDHKPVSIRDIDRYERIRTEVAVDADLMEDLRGARLTATETDQTLHRDHQLHSTNFGVSDAWRSLRDDLRRTFRELTTRDMPVPSRVGSDLNVDAVVQRAAGDTSRDKLSERSQTIARGGRLVAVSADMSDSMAERQVKLAVAAIAEATTMVGDDFLATCWAQLDAPRGGYRVRRESTLIGLVCDHQEPFQWAQLDAFDVGGGTPTADGVNLTAQLVTDLHAREKLLIVITDGEPTCGYRGETLESTDCPVGDARAVVDDVRSKNIQVIGLFVGDSADETGMAEIFGPHGYVEASMDDLASEKLAVYREQLRV